MNELSSDRDRLARFERAPVSQERMEVDPDLAQVRLRPKAAADHERPEDEVERLDPDEAVARIIWCGSTAAASS